jgi:hypothetical protein
LYAKSVGDQQAPLLKEPEELVERWHQHFYELLNQPGSIDEGVLTQFLPEEMVVHEGLETPFTEEEVYIGLAAMNNNKAPGEDSRPIEFYNFAESKLLVPTLTKCFNEALQSGVVPSQWKDVIISILFKKGDKRDCNNYRGLSLITHIGKLLERLIQNRLLPFAENNNVFPESQHGFRPDRSTVDAIYVSRLVSGSAKEHQRPLYKCFVDLTKAYDKVDRETLWKVLALRGIPPKMVQLIRALHIGAQARVKVSGNLSSPFQLERGLKQGSVFAPLLFNIFFGAIIEATRKKALKFGCKFNYFKAGDILDANMGLSEAQKNRKRSCIALMELLFADDAVLMADSLEELQQIVDAFVLVTDAYGQEVSIKKTEVMIVNGTSEGVEVCIKGKKLNVVNEFKYVGSTESSDATMDREIDIRIQRMAAAYRKLTKNIFASRYIKTRTKLQTYCTVVLANGLYGCATWNTTAEHMRKLEGWQYKTLRELLGYDWKDFVSYSDILQITGKIGHRIFPLEIEIRSARLRYLGHVQRMQDRHRLPFIALHSHVAIGKRRKGSPCMTYRRVIKDDMVAFNISTKTWEKDAMNRVEWRTQLHKAKEGNYVVWCCKREEERAARYEAKGQTMTEALTGELPRAMQGRRQKTSDQIRRRWHVLDGECAVYDEVHIVVLRGINIVTNRGGRERKKKTTKVDAPKRKKKPPDSHTSRERQLIAALRRAMTDPLGVVCWSEQQADVFFTPGWKWKADRRIVSSLALACIDCGPVVRNELSSFIS